jgi:RIP metalloprotease RseP
MSELELRHNAPDTPVPKVPVAAAAGEAQPLTPLSSAVRLAFLALLFVGLGLWQGWGVVVVVAAILVMIFFHELGHFVMARRAGMKVTQFFIGFGPRIWSFHRGEVEYGVRAIPAGAFVKIIGMTSEEDVAPEDEPRTYRQAKFGDRIGVAVAGSAMHFIMALVLLFGVLWVHGRPSDEAWTVRSVSPGTAAAEAGLRPGDRVVSVDGTSTPTFAKMGTAVRTRPGQQVDLVVLRDGGRQTLPVKLGGRINLAGTIGEDLSFDERDTGVRLTSVEPGSRTAGAGLQTDDHVVGMNGAVINGVSDVATVVKAASGGSLAIEVERGGQRSTHEVNLGTAVEAEAPRGFLGVAPADGYESLSATQAAGESFATFGRVTKMGVQSLGVIFNPVNIAHFAGRVLSGPPKPVDDGSVRSQAQVQAQTNKDNLTRPSSIVGIVDIGSTLVADLPALLVFLATINIIIGVFNLIPLLPLDGGHVVIACYERIRELRRGDGRRYMVDMTKLMPLLYTVVVILAVVGLLAIAADITQPLKI